MRVAGDDFYVGYLNAPPRHVRFLRRVIPLVMAGLACVMAAVAVLQRSPGDAVWETGAPRRVKGVLHALPYPAVFVDDGTAYLLVESGKRGAQERAAAFDGRRVTVSGWVLERDGRKILELEAGIGAFAAESEEAVAVESIRDVPTFAPIVVRGEIVDAKCYLGAMKPGDGKGHKACATLCVTSGIPPMFVSSVNGVTSYHLIVDREHRSAEGVVRDFIGEPVELRPSLAKWGALDVYVVGAESIVRR